MITRIAGKELREKQIKKLKLTYGDDSKRKQNKIVEVNGVIVREVEKIKIKHSDDSVVLILKNKDKGEIGRVCLYDTSEIFIDGNLGIYRIEK